MRADDLMIEQTHFAAAHLVREWHLADAITVLGDIRFGVRRKLDHLEDEYCFSRRQSEASSEARRSARVTRLNPKTTEGVFKAFLL